MLPTLLTIGNLILGFSAIIVIIQPAAVGFTVAPLELAVWLIVAAGILDAIDGPLARRGKSRVTPWGAELDALADVISFGVAPAVVIGTAAPEGWQGAVIVAGIVFVLAGTWRLARFLWAGATAREGRFSGLPSTAAGLAVVAFWLFEYDRLGGLTHIGIATAGMIVLALLMVSRIAYEKFPELGEGGTRNRVKWVVTAVAVIAIALDPPRAGLAVVLLYLAHGPLAVLIRRRRTAGFDRGSEGDAGGG